MVYEVETKAGIYIFDNESDALTKFHALVTLGIGATYKKTFCPIF